MVVQQAAYIYARKGARLVLAARREENLEEVARKARQMGASDVMEMPTDVTKIDDCQKLIDETVSRFGRIDHLMLNAGLAMSFYMVHHLTRCRSRWYRLCLNQAVPLLNWL